MSKRITLITFITGVCLYLDVAFSQSLIFSALSLTGICIVVVTLLFSKNPNFVLVYVFLVSLVYGICLQQNLGNLILSWALTALLIYVFSELFNFTSQSWWWSLGFFNLWAILLIAQGTQWTILQYLVFLIVNLIGVRFINWLLNRFGEQQHLRYDW